MPSISSGIWEGVIASLFPVLLLIASAIDVNVSVKADIFTPP
jgi:hypothetical protein